MLRLEVPDPDLRALAEGETIVVFRSGSGFERQEVELRGAGPRPPEELQTAYRRWAEAGPPEGRWTARIERVEPTHRLDPEQARARHILAKLPEGDLLLLRVVGPDGPVLSDQAFVARVRSLEAALR